MASGRSNQETGDISEQASGSGLLRQVQLSGVHQLVSNYRTAGLRNPLHLLRSQRAHGGEQVAEAVSVQLPQPW